MAHISENTFVITFWLSTHCWQKINRWISGIIVKRVKLTLSAKPPSQLVPCLFVFPLFYFSPLSFALWWLSECCIPLPAPTLACPHRTGSDVIYTVVLLFSLPLFGNTSGELSGGWAATGSGKLPFLTQHEYYFSYLKVIQIKECHT